MAYYSAQQKSNKKWHYTCQNGAGIFDIGYCDKCRGHDTELEAMEHYRQYNIDHAVEMIDTDIQKKCQICQEWTQSFMAFKETTLPKQYYLCKNHCNKEGLELVTRRT